MTDLLSQLQDPMEREYHSRQDELGKRMVEDWQRNLDQLMRSGRIPNWLELDSLLQRDELRLLDLIEERAGYVMGDHVRVEYPARDGGLMSLPVVRYVDSLTHDAGFDSPGNAKATVNRCLANKWIRRSIDAVTRRERYDLTERGRWVKDLVEYDAWFEEDSL